MLVYIVTNEYAHVDAVYTDLRKAIEQMKTLEAELGTQPEDTDDADLKFFDDDLYEPTIEVWDTETSEQIDVYDFISEAEEALDKLEKE